MDALHVAAEGNGEQRQCFFRSLIDQQDRAASHSLTARYASHTSEETAIVKLAASTKKRTVRRFGTDSPNPAHPLVTETDLVLGSSARRRDGSGTGVAGARPTLMRRARRESRIRSGNASNRLRVI
jgi:hypothetical protein